jgi:PmbA protein
MIVDQIVERAMVKARGAQASLQRTESIQVSFENDQLKAAQSAQRTQIEVKVIVDGQLGTSSTTDMDDLDGVVARALEAAEFGSPAHFEFPGPQRGTRVKVYDPALPPVTKAEMIQIGQEMMDQLKTYNPDILVEAEVTKRIRQLEFANSSGSSFADESTDFGMEVVGQLIRGTDILFAGHGLGRKKRDIDPAAIAGKAIEWFRLAERTVPIQSGEMPVVFAPEALEVLGLTLRLALDGKNVLLGSSPLAGKLGETIADQRFSLIDDPLIDYAAHSARYDGEGVARQVTPLIQEGVLKNFLYDLDTAGRAGAKSTGHGPGREPSNLIVQGGDTPYEKMLKQIEGGLLVQRVMGLGQGNPIGGEFSVNVSLGFKIAKGEIVGRVKNIMLAGNVYDALQDIVAIGDHAEWVSSGRAPYVHIGKMSVVAQ